MQSYRTENYRKTCTWWGGYVKFTFLCLFVCPCVGKKNGSFGLLSVGSCVGKKQMCHLRFGFFTLTGNGSGLCVRAGFSAENSERATKLKFTKKCRTGTFDPPDAKPLLAVRCLYSLFRSPNLNLYFYFGKT